MATNQQRREAAKRKLERQITRRAEQARRRRIIGVVVAVVAVLVAAGLIVVLEMSDGDSAAEEPTDQPQAGEEQAGDEEEISIPSEPIAAPQRSEPLPDSVSCDYSDTDDAAQSVNPPSGEDVSSQGTVPVTLHSTAGDVPLELDRSLAPCAVQSFTNLVEQDFYTDTSCHRLGTTDLQMLQCGDPTGEGDGGPGYAFDDEVFDDLEYGRGILAMANSGPDTNGSQFFLVYGDAPLPPDYTVFGTIDDEGLTVLDEVARGGDDGSFEPNPGGGEPHVEVTFTGSTIDV